MNPTPADLIEISELHFSYAKRKIFRGLSLRIPRGKVVAILGASGSGKSTLLRLLSGQLRPDRGWIRVDGQVVHKLDTAELYALRRRMGMMFSRADCSPTCRCTRTSPSRCANTMTCPKS